MERGNGKVICFCRSRFIAERTILMVYGHLFVNVKGLPNGVAREKKGNKRPLSDERSVSFST